MYKFEYENLRSAIYSNLADSTKHSSKTEAEAMKNFADLIAAHLDDVWEEADARNNWRIPFRNSPEYKHNNSVYGDELEGYTERNKLYNADPNCKHEVYGASGGGVKCIKCGGWYCG
jgi:hypothetical protein